MDIEIKKERRRAVKRRWQQANPEKGRAAHRRWQDAHPGRFLELAARYRRNHPGRVAASDKRWREGNPDKARENHRRWELENPGQRAVLNAKRRARKAEATPVLTVYEQAQVLAVYAIARARTVQTGVAHHVDHIVPLARGGLHHPVNLQVLTARENLKKGSMVQLK